MKLAQPNDEPQKLQFWVMWIAILGGLPVLQIFVGGGWPEGDDQGDISTSLLSITLAGVLASALIRWVVLPRIKSPQALLTTMVIGLALAEGTGLMGMFLISSEYPETQRSAFILSLLGMCQFIPTYANDLP